MYAKYMQENGTKIIWWWRRW